MARMVKIILAFLLSTQLYVLESRAAPPANNEVLAPKSIRYRIDLKNGADILDMMNKTQWLVDLQKTNLYRGLMIRMSGLLGALPSKEKPTWQGKLVDFVLSKALSGRALSVWYFQSPTLVSPIGASVYDLGETEKAVLLKIVESLRTAPDKKVDYNQVSGNVTPIAISAQKIAISFSGGCLGISRDPLIAFASAESCKSSKAPQADAVVSINIESLSASTSEALKKFLGLELGYR